MKKSGATFLCYQYAQSRHAGRHPLGLFSYFTYKWITGKLPFHIYVKSCYNIPTEIPQKMKIFRKNYVNLKTSSARVTYTYFRTYRIPKMKSDDAQLLVEELPQQQHVEVRWCKELNKDY